MSKNNVQFVTIADADYFEPVCISAKQIKKFYPGSTLHIYDWGLKTQQIEVLEDYHNVSLHKWNIKLPSFFTPFGAWNIKQEIKNLAKLSIGFFQNKSIEFSWGPETNFFNKILCLKKINKKIKKPFVYLDGDAFLINDIDRLVNKKFDIGVTRRRAEELNYEFNNCSVLNAGVIFFFADYKINEKFINTWLEETLNTREYLAEQTSLTRLLCKKKENIFKRVPSSHRINIQNTPIKVRVLSCEKYNYNWIEEFESEEDKESIKILHFKSGRFDSGIFDKIASKFNL